MEPGLGMTWTEIIFSQIIRFGGVFTILTTLYAAVALTHKILSKIPSSDSKS